MSHAFYDAVWSEAMAELLDQLETEHPDDPSLAPKTLAEWATLYLRYVSIVKKLDEVYDQMVHPQKRPDVRRALDAALGRTMEVRNWLVTLNGGIDRIPFEDVLADLKLPPDATEVPVPRYFIADRAKELEERVLFLEELMKKYAKEPAQDVPLVMPAPLVDVDEAVRLIQANERGRQGRQRSAAMRDMRNEQAFEARMVEKGVTGEMRRDIAVRVLQTCARGFLGRLSARREREAEMALLGMVAPPRPPRDADAQVRAAQVAERRRQLQTQRQQEMDKALVDLKRQLRAAEEESIREVIQDKVNQWFVEKRDPVSGQYPEFPEPDDGGSRDILNPPPQAPAEEEGGGKDKKGGKKDDKKKDDTKKDGKKKGEKGKGKGKGKGGDDEENKADACSELFSKQVEGAVHDYTNLWRSREDSGDIAQRHDADLVRESLRPLIFEEVRLEVDEELRLLLENLKAMVEAEKAAKSGKKAKGKKGGKKKGGKKKGGKKKGGKKGAAGKGAKKARKDPTADVSIEYLFAELVQNEIVRSVPADHTLASFVASPDVAPSARAKVGNVPHPTLAQARANAIAYCVVPLGSPVIHATLPQIKTVLLYGPPGCGKSHLAHAAAAAAGANFLDISPKNTDGKFTKQAAMMMHKVFKVARVMGPSVVFVDEAEKVFISDKKKCGAGLEPYNRIRKDLGKEVDALEATDLVVVIGATNDPAACSKKDEAPFINFWERTIHCPLPYYGDRLALWPSLAARFGGAFPSGVSVSSLAHISDAQSTANIAQILRRIFTPRRIEVHDRRPVSMDELMLRLGQFKATAPEVFAALQAWEKLLPGYKEKFGGGGGTGDADTGEKKEKGGKKKKKK